MPRIEKKRAIIWIQISLHIKDNIMFIGYYKSVNSNKEFYSAPRGDLNFPTQVEYKDERYLLNKTIQIYGDNIKRLIKLARDQNVDFNVELD